MINGISMCVTEGFLTVMASEWEICSCAANITLNHTFYLIILP
jgi:hypothetical protein